MGPLYGIGGSAYEVAFLAISAALSAIYWSAELLPSGRTLLEKAKRAGDGIRTHDNDVGNVVLYQLSYTRLHDLPPASRDSVDKLGVNGL